MSSAEREGQGYTFYRQTGPQARLSNSFRTAERHLARVEFQNAVVMSNVALEDGRPFQVLIESKVNTWSGSIIIGATTIPPESFSFPANLSCLTSGCWVVSGRSLWKNGYRKLPNYVPEMLETLAEGSSVGVVKRGQSLHFLVNGADLDAAEEALPPETKVWALVDLYGQCSRVSVVDFENRQSTPSPATPLLFHSRCGENAQILDGGTVAYRKSPESEFHQGVVLSNRPLIDGELFEVEISAMQERWSGSVELGVTTHSPEELEFPATMSSVTSGTWIMSGCSIMCNGATTIQNYANGLDTLKVGDRVGLKRLSNGSLVFYINGAEQGVAASNIPDQLYAVVDIYGQCSRVRLTTAATQGDARLPLPSQGMNGISPPERREPLQLQPTFSSRDDQLRFHTHCGENAELEEEGRVASRRNPYDEFTGATVLTSRPLRPGEMFEVMIGVIIDTWSGSLQMGVCQVDPELLDFEAIEELTDVNLPYWILSGSDIHCEESSPDSDYPLDLDAIPEGSKVGLKVTLDGDLHFFINGVDMGVAASGLPTEGLYGCAEIYGTCAQVSIVDRHDSAAINHKTTEGAPVISLDDRVTSTANSANHREESVPVSHSPWRHQFHHIHGLNVCLSKDRTVAERFQGFDEGLVFSHQPLQPGEAFEVELTELSSRAWQGSLRVGLVAKLPKSLPSSLTELGEGSWALLGSSLLHNGSTVKQDFYTERLQLKVGSRLSVWCEIDGWMHVSVDDVDGGPLLPVTAKLPYVVVDLYGGAKSVKIIPLEEAMQGGAAPSSSDARMQWSSECGSNVQLLSDYRSAKRTKSYSKGILISSSPLPNDRLFQCTVKELDGKWEGTLSLGVTSQLPHQACLVEKAQELKKRSYILCTEAGVTCLYIGGKEVCKLPDVNLSSLKENDTIGILCKSCDRTLHFYISSTHLEVKLPDGDMRLPSSRYAVVDMYGQCCAVEFRGLGDAQMDDGDGVIRIQIDKEQLTHVKRHIKNRKAKKEEQQQHQQQPVGEESVVGQIPPDSVSEGDLQKQEEPTGNSSIGDGVSERRSAHSPTLTSQSPFPSILKRPCDGARSYTDCAYFKQCRGFLERLSIPDVFLSSEPEHTKCYCDRCCQLRGEPDVKYSGNPPTKYAVPHGWVKFGLKLSFGPQADRHKSFDMWHKAYHGTSPGRVRSILDHGGLLLPGSSLLDGGAVAQPPGHYTDKWKPANHDPHRIFVSPSIKYCSFRDVYTKSHKFEAGGKQYDGRVCFKVLIKPGYDVSRKTIATRDGEVIDRNFEDSKLEWSTSVDRGIYLYGLMVWVDDAKPRPTK